MALCPFADHRLIPESTTQPGITPRAVVVHSQAGRGSLYGWWNNPGSNGLESHFWIAESGEIEQYVPTTIRADAQGDANAFAISIETESSREATERWNPRQAAALVRLLDWICDTHGIPRRRMVHSTDSGIGWHVMFGAPGPWTSKAGKTCPGPARITQLVREILPALNESDDLDVDEKTLRKILADEIGKHPAIKRIDTRTGKIDSRTGGLVTQAALLVRLARVTFGWSKAIAEDQAETKPRFVALIARADHWRDRAYK